LPYARERRMALDHPRVVVVREDVQLGIRPRSSSVRETAGRPKWRA
jgi:hypothetical protein